MSVMGWLLIAVLVAYALCIAFVLWLGGRR